MNIGPFQLLIIALHLVVVGVPIAKILGRLGYAKGLVIIAFIPLVNIIGLWILAYANWPSQNLARQHDA